MTLHAYAETYDYEDSAERLEYIEAADVVSNGWSFSAGIVEGHPSPNPMMYLRIEDSEDDTAMPYRLYLRPDGIAALIAVLSRALMVQQSEYSPRWELVDDGDEII